MADGAFALGAAAGALATGALDAAALALARLDPDSEPRQPARPETPIKSATRKRI
jgi:hypothetical protein